MVTRCVWVENHHIKKCILVVVPESSSMDIEVGYLDQCAYAHSYHVALVSISVSAAIRAYLFIWLLQSSALVFPLGWHQGELYLYPLSASRYSTSNCSIISSPYPSRHYSISHGGHHCDVTEHLLGDHFQHSPADCGQYHGQPHEHHRHPYPSSTGILGLQPEHLVSRY